MYSPPRRYTVTPPSGKKFYCWNTAADESGTAYFPGDALTLSGECTVLYAIWKTQAEIDAAQQLAADRAAADAVQGKISEIGEVSFSEASKAKINAARAAYNALNDAQKALVENYTVLTAAEARYAELKAAAETPVTPDEPESSGNNGGTSFRDFWQRIIHWFRRLFAAIRDWFVR